MKTEDVWRGFVIGFVSIAVVIFVVVFNIFSYGFVISKLWLWFITPIFHCRTISILEGISLKLFLTVLMQNPSVMAKENKEKIMEKVFMIIFCPWFYLFVGYFFHVLSK